jgi:hypothetical protein
MYSIYDELQEQSAGLAQLSSFFPHFFPSFFISQLPISTTCTYTSSAFPYAAGPMSTIMTNTCGVDGERVRVWADFKYFSGHVLIPGESYTL